MTQQDQLERVWIVVEVCSGIPTLAEAYRRREPACARERALRLDMHPENDETGVFETQITDRTALMTPV